jgi:hypothetical protein
VQEGEKMQMASEIMSDAMDEMTGAEEDEEAERILQEVLDKQALDVSGRVGGSVMPSVATQGQAYQNPSEPVGVDVDNVDDRLAQLRR